MAEKVKFSKRLEAEIEDLILHIKNFTNYDYSNIDLDITFFKAGLLYYTELKQKWRYGNRRLWEIISSVPTLSDEFIDTFDIFLNWNFVSTYHRLTRRFIKKYINRLYIENLKLRLDENIFSEDFIEELCIHYGIFNYISITDIILYAKKLSRNFIEKYKDKIDWNQIYCTKYDNRDFVDKYKDYIDWDIINLVREIRAFEVSSCNIKTFLDDPTLISSDVWDDIVLNNDLSNLFLEYFGNFLNWDLICKQIFYNKMNNISFSLLLKHQNKIKDWNYISLCPELSLEVIDKLSEFLDFNKIILCYNKNITRKFIERYKDRIDWDEVSNKIDLRVCQKYYAIMDYINYKILLKNCGYLFIEFIENNYSFIESKIGSNNIWQCLSLNKKLPMRFIDKYKDKLYMDNFLDSIYMYRGYILKNIKYFSFEALKKCDKINKNDKLKLCSMINLENNSINLDI